MKTSEFRKYLGGSSACTKRLSINNKGCGQLTSSDTYFAGIWFSYIKTAEEAMAAGVNYCRPAKTIHKGFCLGTFENLMKDWSGGSYLVMKRNPRFPGGIPLLDSGYRYNYRMVLGFIATEGAGSTSLGDTYLSRFPDNYSNDSVFPIFRPHFLDSYFNACNSIDNHNRIQ